MGLLSDLFFGFSEPVKSCKSRMGAFGSEYDDYYGDFHDDAMSGDIDAQTEIREEFGDDWEGEY